MPKVKTNNNKGYHMKLVSFFMLMVMFYFLSISIQAREISGISIPETISHSDQSTKLVLNGAGIRSKFIFDIYIGALYLTKKVSTANEVYHLPGEKRVSMHFLYKEVSKDKLVAGWNEGFENNLSKKDYNEIKPRLVDFDNLFITVKKGDVVDIDLIPTTGTVVTINHKTMGTIEGDDFYVALLKVWLGDDPADSNLKNAMLGIKTEQ